MKLILISQKKIEAENNHVSKRVVCTSAKLKDLSDNIKGFSSLSVMKLNIRNRILICSSCREERQI